jgi:signal peptidase I
MWLVALTLGVAGAVALLWWLRARFVVVEVHGRSMRPTLRGGDRVLVRRLAADRVRAGQVVVVERPLWRDDAWHWPVRQGRATGRKWMIKRAAAVSGEPVPDVLDGVVRESTVPAGALVVLGDNAAESTDSRELGFVPAERVLGIALRRMSRSRRADSEPDARPVPVLSPDCVIEAPPTSEAPGSYLYRINHTAR